MNNNGNNGINNVNNVQTRAGGLAPLKGWIGGRVERPPIDAFDASLLALAGGQGTPHDKDVVWAEYLNQVLDMQEVAMARLLEAQTRYSELRAEEPEALIEERRSTWAVLRDDKRSYEERLHASLELEALRARVKKPARAAKAEVFRMEAFVSLTAKAVGVLGYVRHRRAAHIYAPIAATAIEALWWNNRQIAVNAVLEALRTPQEGECARSRLVRLCAEAEVFV